MMKLSDREKRLLFLLVLLLLSVGTVKFGYLDINEKTNAVETENIDLTTQLSQLSLLASQKDDLINKTTQLELEDQKIIGKYGPGNSPEKSIMFLVELSDKTGMNISDITFGEMMKATADAGEQAADGTNVTNVTNSGIYLYTTPLSFSYSATYSNLKAAVDYINKYPERMTIESVTASYDPTAGVLKGTIALNLYEMTGTTKKYTEPEIKGISTGLLRPFGTE